MSESCARCIRDGLEARKKPKCRECGMKMAELGDVLYCPYCGTVKFINRK